MHFSKEQILTWLDEVKDPEIPVLSLVDLGVITKLDLTENGVAINMTPTFSGCPAIDTMRQEIIEVLTKKGLKEVTVNVNFDTIWNSDMISEKGRIAIKKFGLAPPPHHNLIVDIDIMDHANCPRCNGSNTEMKSPFGATLCRSIHYCLDCKESFEQFKPI